MRNLENEILGIIHDNLNSLKRGDLFREPLVSFSAADDSRYLELKQVIGEWHLTPLEILPNAKSVISYFVPFTKPVSNMPGECRQATPLWGEAYVVLNPHFEVINQAIVSYLVTTGYEASSIPATHTYDPLDIKCTWSHRSAACIAGLGTFGLNRMLITEKGSGGRFCTVVTSALLNKDSDSEKERCPYPKDSSCGKCIKACPVQALTAEGFDKFLCQAETLRNKEANKDNLILREADVCGKCISVCPYAYVK